jgi:hypothetical protein
MARRSQPDKIDEILDLCHLLRCQGVDLRRRNTFDTRTQYTQANGKTIAIYISRTNGVDDLRYLHQDYLGSVDVIADETGHAVERLCFAGWGKRSPSCIAEG